MRHVLTHSKERQFQCNECNKGFYRKDHLKNHMETHNPNKAMYRCPRAVCGKEYTSSTGLKKHVAMHEAEDGNLICTLCGITFQARDDIIYHLKTHAGSRTVKSAQDKKFQCDMCKKRFFTRKDVKRHMVVHTGTRDFVCDQCPQKFGRKDHLVRHVKKSHSASPGAPPRRGRVKSEPPTGIGSPERPPAPPSAAAGAASDTGGGAVFAASQGDVYFAEEREDVSGSSSGPYRPLAGSYQPPPLPLHDMDLSDPALLSTFEPSEVLPDLGHTSADLSTELPAVSYVAGCPEPFYLPAQRLAEPALVRVSEPAAHLTPELFPLTGPLRPPLSVRARLPPSGKDLSALMQSAMASSSGPAVAPTETTRSPSPGHEYSHYRYFEQP
ncbi:zinc finger protein PLAGL1-like isoform X2 [Amphibalanus amphitrite]|nr:zinc finger protein PLAGL1-like isoform X2 [Amphibalanus amphitrite]